MNGMRTFLDYGANSVVMWLSLGIGISIGVSYKLDLLFTSVTVTAELGATVNLWGPPTGGVAYACFAANR